LQRNWSKRNVDLKELKEKISEFFKDNYFDVIVSETKNGYQLFAKGSPNYRIDGQIFIAIEGKPEDFSITIDLKTKKTPRIFLSPILMTLFGGGYFLMQHLKSNETWIELKRDFWEYVDRVIIELSSSVQLEKKEI